MESRTYLQGRNREADTRNRPAGRAGKVKGGAN